MKMTVIGSGSSGNCYLLDDGEQILVIEAGVPFSEVKEAIYYRVSRIVGVLSSHEHGDHRKYLHEYEAAGIPVFKGNTYYPSGNLLIKELSLDIGGCVELGGFNVYPFPVPHDVPCCGYLITHREMGRMIFVTDAEYVKYTFPGVNHIMVEANYAQDIIDENVNDGIIPDSLRKRIMKSHTSLETAKGIVTANKNPLLRNVVLLHLSGHNSDRKRFVSEVQDIAGEYCNVAAAEKGMVIDFNWCPF